MEKGTSVKGEFLKSLSSKYDLIFVGVCEVTNLIYLRAEIDK